METLVGGLLRVEFLPIPGIAITGRAGYIHHLTKDLEGDAGHVKLGELPILAGVKIYSPVGVYGALELGGTWLNPSIEAGTFTGTDFDSSSFKFSGTVGVGFAAGPVDLRGGLNIVDIGHIGDTMQVGISLGFNFITI